MTDLHNAHVIARNRDLAKQILIAGFNNSTDERPIFVEFHGHCDHFGVRVFDDGWSDTNLDPSYELGVFLNHDGIGDSLIEALKVVTS